MTTEQFLNWFASASMQEISDRLTRTVQVRPVQVERGAVPNYAARDRYTRELQRRAIVQRAYQRSIEPSRLARTRRSRTDWEALTGDDYLARSQVAWERSQTALAMRRAGLSSKEMGHRFGVSVTRVRQIVAKAERVAKRQKPSPIERWMTWSPASLVEPASLQRTLAQLAQPRDWLLVASRPKKVSHG